MMAGDKDEGLGDSACQAALRTESKAAQIARTTLLPPPHCGCRNPASSWLFLLDKGRRTTGLGREGQGALLEPAACVGSSVK